MCSCLSVTMGNFNKMWGYGKRFLKVTPELIFGTASEAMGDTFRKTQGSLFTKAKAGWNTLEKAGKGSFFKGFYNNIKTFIPCIKSNIQTHMAAAKAAGKSGLWGGIKGLCKGIGKKMPFIGALSMMLFELPNIFKATKEQGIFQGGAEVIKAGARLTGGGLGAAIGSAIIPIPFVGSMIGWVTGEWLAGKIVGKSYSEQQAKKEEEFAQFQQLQQQMMNPQDANSQQQVVDTQYQYPQQVEQRYNTNPFWMNNQTAQQQNVINSAQNPQTPELYQQMLPQNVYNPTMTGLYNNIYNTQQIPYSNDIMMQQMPFNRVI